MLPLKEGFTTCIDFQLPEETVQSNPWADMVVNTMDEDGYTRLNITFIPRTPLVSGGPIFRGKIIDFSYPPEFEVDVFFPDYRIDFYADWCGPCKKIAPVLEELAKEYDGKVIIYKVDTEAEQELAAAFGIRSIPSMLFCPKDEQPQMAQGALPKHNLEQVIKDVLKVEK